MAIKDIVLHMSSKERSAERLKAGLQIAQTFDAHLTAVHVIEELVIPAYAEAQIPTRVLRDQRKSAARRTKQVEKAFKKSAKAAGVAYEWRAMEGDPVQALSLNARYADLVIAGQPEDRETDKADAEITEHLALESGRPVLVIPYIGGTPPGYNLIPGS